MGHQTKEYVRSRVEFYLRNLRNAGLATDAELDSVAKSCRGQSSKDDLWECLAELKSLARLRKAQAQRQGNVQSADAYEAAIAALEERAETVYLKSINETVLVRPGSWARIMLIEDVAWWVNRLIATHAYLMSDEAAEQLSEREDIQLRVIDELSYQRTRLYSQLVAPSAAPVAPSEHVKWADDITPLEEGALLQAYHRVNYDLISSMPTPTSKDGKRPLPNHWAFVFQSVAWRERRPPLEIIRDRSLVSVVASTVLEHIKTGEGVASEDMAEALGGDI